MLVLKGAWELSMTRDTTQAERTENSVGGGHWALLVLLWLAALWLKDVTSVPILIGERTGGGHDF